MSVQGLAKKHGLDRREPRPVYIADPAGNPDDQPDCKAGRHEWVRFGGPRHRHRKGRLGYSRVERCWVCSRCGYVCQEIKTWLRGEHPRNGHVELYYYDAPRDAVFPEEHSM